MDLHVPTAVSRLKGVPMARKCVAGSIFTRTYMQNHPGFAYITVAEIMADWDISEHAVYIGVKWLEAEGFIEVHRTVSDGNAFRWVASVEGGRS